MMEQEMDVSLKVIVVGNGRVGKTSMITRFAKGVATDNYKKTIGTDFMEKEITLTETGENIKLMLWDTAGQEMFSKLTRSYYKGSGAVVYVFSTVDRDSFEEITRWKDKVEEECGEIVSVLVQNKIDLLDEAQVSSEEVEELARRTKMKLYRTCVKDNILVDDVFEYVSDLFMKRGGEASLGSQAVQNIGQIGRRKSQLDAEANAKQNENMTNARGVTVSLEPSTVRTGGKKKQFCTIL